MTKEEREKLCERLKLRESHSCLVNERDLYRLAHTTIQSLGEEVERLREALVELVECKDLKEHIEALELRQEPSFGFRRDYQNRKEPAWASARAALTASPTTNEPSEP